MQLTKHRLHCVAVAAAQSYQTVARDYTILITLICVAATGVTHLDNKADVWVVHAAGADIGGEHDDIAPGAEGVGGLSSCGLALARVDLERWHAQRLCQTYGET